MHLLQNGNTLEINNFINLIEHNKIQQNQTAELKTIIKEFPYFQSARVLYLKGLKNQESFKYNKELKTTAAYTTDRTVLFDFITSEDFNLQNTNSVQSNKEENFNEFDTEINYKDNSNEFQEIKKKTKEELKIGKPIVFSNSENFSFNQWLQLSVKKPIVRTKHNNQKNSSEEAIIDRFIESNPKIKPLSKEQKVSISVTKNQQNSALMTETLAKVYLEQKKYENAIQAYRILSLKYPEKSGFFADQIKRIKILQKHK